MSILYVNQSLLCYHKRCSFIGSTIIAFLYNHTSMQLLNRKYQVPVLAPNDIATINGEKAELAGVKILVVLRVWVTTDEVTYINHSGGIVAECQANGKIACVLSLCNIYSFHSWYAEN